MIIYNRAQFKNLTKRVIRFNKCALKKKIL